jgi:LemA protein
MKKSSVITIVIGIVLLLAGTACVSWWTGTYDGLIKTSQRADKALSNIDEAYRRRADLLENLVEIVKSEVGAENEVVVEYAKARAAQGGQITLTADTLKDPAAMAAYKQNQSSLGNFLGRMMVVAEKIPDPNFSKAYAELRASLDGVNNRIGIAIKDYNTAVEIHNNYRGGFWRSIVADHYADKFKERPYYKVEEEKKVNPKLKDMNMDMRTKK